MPYVLCMWKWFVSTNKIIYVSLDNAFVFWCLWNKDYQDNYTESPQSVGDKPINKWYLLDSCSFSRLTKEKWEGIDYRGCFKTFFDTDI